MNEEIPQIEQDSEDAIEKFARCPFCGAVFKFNISKLRVRGGEVRCGSCREVFNANAHCVVRNASGVFVAIEELANAAITESVQPRAEIVNPLREIIRQNLERTVQEHSDERAVSTDDEAGEEESYPQVTDTARGGNTRLEFPIEPPLDQERSIEWSIDEEQELEEAVLDTYMEHRPTPRENAQGIDTTLDNERQSSRANWFSAEPDSLYDNNPFSVQADTESSVAADDQRPSIINTSDVDEYIIDRPNPLVGIFWFLVCVAFVGLLGLQVKYYFVERFAQNESYRPYLGVFCRVARCQLPPRRDAYRFTITHTRIDLHPREPGALRITVKLLNQAKFTQPYPELQLTLTDRVGRVVGRRTFPPDFYLAQDQQSRLGSGELGSAAFDLAHPHEKAVGFVVDIVRDPGT